MGKVNTTRFGEITVQDTDILTMPEGLFGFETLNKFFIVDPEDNTLILWLQAVDNPNVAFPIIEPQIFHPMYEKKFITSDLVSLEMTEISEAKYYAIITIPKQLTDMTVNLKAPIFINQKTKVARQVVLQDSKLPVDHKVYTQLKAYIINNGNKDAEVKKDELAVTL